MWSKRAGKIPSHGTNPVDQKKNSLLDTLCQSAGELSMWTMGENTLDSHSRYTSQVKQQCLVCLCLSDCVCLIVCVCCVLVVCMCVLDVLCVVWRVQGVYTVCVCVCVSCGVHRVCGVFVECGVCVVWRVHGVRVFTQNERKSHVDQNGEKTTCLMLISSTHLMWTKR